MRVFSSCVELVCVDQDAAAQRLDKHHEARVDKDHAARYITSTQLVIFTGLVYWVDCNVRP